MPTGPAGCRNVSRHRSPSDREQKHLGDVTKGLHTLKPKFLLHPVATRTQPHHREAPLSIRLCVSRHREDIVFHRHKGVEQPLRQLASLGDHDPLQVAGFKQAKFDFFRSRHFKLSGAKGWMLRTEDKETPGKPVDLNLTLGIRAPHHARVWLQQGEIF